MSEKIVKVKKGILDHATGAVFGMATVMVTFPNTMNFLSKTFNLLSEMPLANAGLSLIISSVIGVGIYNAVSHRLACLNADNVSIEEKPTKTAKLGLN